MSKQRRKKKGVRVKVKGGKFLADALKAGQAQLKRAIEDTFRSQSVDGFTMGHKPNFTAGDELDVTYNGQCSICRVMAIRLLIDGSYRVELDFVRPAPDERTEQS